MSHHHGQQHQHEHQHRDHDGHHRVLDLDAHVFGGQLTAVLDALTDALGDLAPRRVVDLGAGTGTGTRLLRDRFPAATVTAVDHDPAMLDALRTQGFTVLDADLDHGFPAVGPVDLAWAASSLHHVADPAALLAGARAALTPGGALAVVEIEGLPRFTTDPAEDAGRAAALAAGWNHHPDWTGALEAAGFTVTRRDVTTGAPDDAGTRAAAQEYARLWLPRYLHVDGLDRAAADALTALLDGPLALAPQATRALWIAR
ncbi:class I SAM-dependent methyltransferase [Kineococcus sp. SYSU DK002]|uniref:class I SAM-dependent methyltransferase n=1 Tax=Kineococcus sp. SYSU DK002 TaxID=3383123 RepID=UPI003D7EBD82